MNNLSVIMLERLEKKQHVIFFAKKKLFENIVKAALPVWRYII